MLPAFAKNITRDFEPLKNGVMRVGSLLLTRLDTTCVVPFRVTQSSLMLLLLARGAEK